MRLKSEAVIEILSSIIDCNPSFAIYTQLALAAADYVIVPFTADSSRRGIENVIALLYGLGDSHTSTYAKLSFSKRAKEEGLDAPKLHTFVSNRVTLYEGEASKAFKAISKSIKTSLDDIHSKHRSIFANPKNLPSAGFIEVPDFHSACIVASTTGTPIHNIKPGPKIIGGERVQLNKVPLDKYRNALEKFVNCL
jgi:AAA domain